MCVRRIEPTAASSEEYSLGSEGAGALQHEVEEAKAHNEKGVEGEKLTRREEVSVRNEENGQVRIREMICPGLCQIDLPLTPTWKMM
jgi:hypothetical protein